IICWCCCARVTWCFRTSSTSWLNGRKRPDKQSVRLDKREGERMAALVLFGGGGDLAMRMLLPSLYFLEHDGLLPDGLKIIGAARSDESRDEYIAKVRQSVEAKAKADNAWDAAAWSRLEGRLDYLAVDATSAESLKPPRDRIGDGPCTSFL